MFAAPGIHRNWLIASAVLHMALAILLIVGLPERKKPLTPPPPIIIDLVAISDKTRTPTLAQKEIITKKVQKTAAPPPKAAPSKAEQPPEKKPVVKPLKSTLEKEPLKNTIVKPEIKPIEKPKKEIVEKPPVVAKKLPSEIKKPVEKTPVKEPPKAPVKKAEPQPKKEVVKTPVKQPEPKKEVVKKPEKVAEPPKDFSSLIRKSIDNTKPTQTNGAGQKAAAASRELSEVLSVSQMDAVRRHISRCWNIAAIQGARDLDKIVVKTELTMNANRTIQNFRITGGTGQYSPFYNRMVETIERLFQRPDCQTLPLPPGQYDQWKQFQLSFSLKDQLGY